MSTISDFNSPEDHTIDWDELLKECKYLDSNNVPERLKTGWSVRYKTCGFNFYKTIGGKIHSFYLFDDWSSPTEELQYSVMSDSFDPSVHDFDPNHEGLFDSNTFQTYEEVERQLDKLGV